MLLAEGQRQPRAAQVGVARQARRWLRFGRKRSTGMRTGVQARQASQ
jgi:hypothetical protein